MSSNPNSNLCNDFRCQMPVSGQWAYFDHAAVAPLPRPTQQAICEWTNDLAQYGLVHWKHWSDRVQQVRQLTASLVNAHPDEIALVQNTTAGINLIAEGFPWQSGDNVVVPADEFPSNLYPWLNLAARGVEVRQGQGRGVGIDLDQIAALCDSRTRIVALSWVGFAHGFRCNLQAAAEMAHARGALLFVDAIQGLAVFPLDVGSTPIDFFAADGHKWLLGPEGAGMLYVRREHLDRLRPLGIGWNSVQHAGDFTKAALTLKSAAARYEGGTYNVAGIVGLGASLELLSNLGIESISRRVLEITDEACRRLIEIGATIVSQRDATHSSGIVLFDLPGENPLVIKRRCLERGVVLNSRAGKLRLSPHAYNNTEDLDRLISALTS